MNRTLTLLPVALVLAQPAFAQERAPVKLPPVVVTATRTEASLLTLPAAIDRIDSDAINRAQARFNLSESLQRVPGVLARDRQNQAQDLQISIRGFGARSTFGVRGIRVYTDGLPATTPDGQGQVSHVLLDAAERIEVLRGPFSALYGNSSGGVLNVIGKVAPAQPQLEFGLGMGSDGLERSALGWHGPWRRGQEGSGYRIDASRFRRDGYRDHSQARRDTAQVRLDGRFGGDGRFFLIGNVLDLRADDPQGLTLDELQRNRRAASPGAMQFDTRKSVQQRQLGLRVEHGMGAQNRLVVLAHAGRRETEQLLSVPVATQRNPLHGGGVIDLDRGYNGVDARWRHDSEWLDRPFAFTAGMELQVSVEDRRGYENFHGSQLGLRGALRRDEHNRVSSSESYAQLEWEPSPRVHAQAGLRRSRMHFESQDAFITDRNPDDSGRIDYSEITPVAGLLYELTPSMSLYVNTGRSFETPTFNELAYRSDGSAGLNTALRPARSENFEAGLRGLRADHAFSLALFRSRTRDELVVASNQGGRSTFANATVSRRQGVELSWSGDWSPRWHYAFAYTWLDARYTRAFALCSSTPCARPGRIVPAGNRIPGLPQHGAWAELRWGDKAGFSLALEGQLLSRVYADDSNTVRAPGYARMDLSAQQRWRLGDVTFTGYARVNNLLDQDIVGSVIVNESNGRYYEPAPGRHWLVGIDAALAW